MAKIIEQISSTSWSVTEDIGPATTKYMVYDDDPNIDKYAHEFSRLSQADLDLIKESLGVRSGSPGVDGSSGTSGSSGSSGASGSSGTSGSSGASGASGASGSSGTSGINGISGGHVLTKPVRDREYSARLNGTPGFTYTTPGRNGMSLYPFIPANTLTIKNLKINVASVVAGALVRILVYSDLNGVPYSKLLESTSLDASTQGDKTYTASFTFTAGTTYWLGVHSSSTASLVVLDAVAMMSIGGTIYQNNTNVTTTITFPNAPDILSTTTPSAGYAFSIVLTAV